MGWPRPLGSAFVPAITRDTLSISPDDRHGRGAIIMHCMKFGVKIDGRIAVGGLDQDAGAEGRARRALRQRDDAVLIAPEGVCGAWRQADEARRGRAVDSEGLGTDIDGDL